MIEVRHLGESGLLVRIGERSIAVDPPRPSGLPQALTWSEAERLAGSRGSEPLAAPPELLRFLGRDGVALLDGVQVEHGGFSLLPSAFPPIPYAVPAEAVRKTLSALRRPRLAWQRLSHARRRPDGPPLVLELRAEGRRVLLLQQALHRFTPEPVLARLVQRHGGADLLIAGTDFEDERATGTLMFRFSARRCVLADLVGPVRRRLGLPVRALELTVEVAPPGTGMLREGEVVGG